MQLYFLRHGIAEDASETMPDAQRPLTKKGVSQMQNAAQVIKALDIAPNHLFSSPLTRAQQTAEIVAQALGVEVELRDEVAPGFSINAVAKLVGDLAEDQQVMFVGHEPDFSTTIASLTGGRIVMKKGGLARVDVIMRQPLLGELVWLVAPKIFEVQR